MKVTNRILTNLLLSMLLILGSCSSIEDDNDQSAYSTEGGEGGITGTGDGGGVSIENFTTGSFYKGPMLAGSKIVVYQLNSDGNLTQILSNNIIHDQTKGLFSIKLPRAGIYSLQATGQFFNEITNTYSKEQVRLKVLIETSISNNTLLPDGIHANVLTTLIHDDMLEHIKNSRSYDEAYAQAEAKASQFFSPMTGVFNLSKPFMFIGIEPIKPILPLTKNSNTTSGCNLGVSGNIRHFSELKPTCRPPEEPNSIPIGIGDISAPAEETQETSSEENFDNEDIMQQDKNDSAFLMYLSALLTQTIELQITNSTVTKLINQLHDAYSQPKPHMPASLLTELQKAQQTLDEAQVRTHLEGQFGKSLPDLKQIVTAIDNKMLPPENFSSTQITRTLGSIKLRCFNYDGSRTSSDGCNGNSSTVIGYTYEIEASQDNTFPAIADSTYYYTSNFNWYEADSAEFSAGTWYIRVRKIWDNGQKGLWAETSFAAP